MAGTIRAENLGKRYRLYPSSRARVVELLSLGRLQRHTPLWALRGVRFDLAPGGMLGVVGENGAGKSTLLKLVTGTTEPTEGTLTVEGRIGSLLELGVGFHPEFTGRENARLTASLLGLSDAELAEAEGEIFAFSELGDFLDQPVKVYSSGMIVRLGFSVAACIDPQILVIDEALSVGDDYFQKKSLDRILALRDRGVTILFCSHALYHIRHLCPEALWLHQGEARMLGPTDAVLDAYEDHCRQRKAAVTRETPAGSAPAAVPAAPAMATLGEVRLDQNGGGAPGPFETDMPLDVAATYRRGAAERGVHLALGLRRNDGTIVGAFSTFHDGHAPRTETEGVFRCRFDPLTLLPGRYALVATLLDDTGQHVYNRRDIDIDVRGPSYEPGLVRLPHAWGESAPADRA